MAFAKRIFLFLAVNILVVMMISLILRLFNISPYLTAHGIDYNSLLSFCFIWGMGGAFISLALSKQMAKWLMGVKIINASTHNLELKQLLLTVERLSRTAGLLSTPEVGVYDSPEVNAFATGPSKSRSLVAVSSGLLNKMSQEELEGVIAHEITHITNGDMVTMTLIQGVVNAFVMFLARVLAYAFSSQSKERSSSNGSYFLWVYVFQFIFMILGSMVVAWFSRWREFRADRGGANVAGKEKMLAALVALQNRQNTLEKEKEQPAFAALKISSKKSLGWLHLFATHPPLEERIARLKEGK